MTNGTEQTDDMQEELTQSIEDKKTQIKELLEKIAILEKELKEKNSTIGTLEDALESNNCEMASTEKEKSDLESKCSILQAELKEKELSLKASSQEVERLQKTVSFDMSSGPEQTDDMQDKDAALIALRADLDVQKSLVNDMEKNLKEKNSTIGTLEDVIESLNIDIAEAGKEKSELDSQYTLLQAEIKEKDLSVQNFQKKIEKLELSITPSLSQDDSSRIKALEEEISELRKAEEKSEVDRKELTFKLAESTKQLRDFEGKILCLEQDLASKASTCR